MAERIVLFGGTFDPVHVGHLIVARSVAEHLGFERILLVPSASPPHKTSACASADHRLAMLRLAIEGEGLFDVCEVELSRARSGASYTIDTIEAFRRRHGPEAEIHLIIGADMLEDLPQWFRASQVVDSARIVVALRPPWDQRIDEIFEAIERRFGPERRRRIRGDVIGVPLLEISSSQIRSRVHAGRSIRYLVPESVRKYIEQLGLYRQPPERPS